MGFVVEVRGRVQVVGQTFATPLTTIPGIGAGAAYAAGDAFGDKFTLNVPHSGVIHTALMLDKDDEGIETELVLFAGDFTAAVDNAVFSVTDADMEGFVGTISFTVFKNFGANQVSTVSAIGLTYVAPQGRLWVQAVTRGAPNIAAANIPMVRLLILADE